MRSTVQTEQLGVMAVGKAATGSGWFFRVLPNPDEGVDAQIEAPTDEGRPSGCLLGLQIKSGPSHATPILGGWRYSIKARHLEYWQRYSLPVVIVIYHPDTDTAYWQPVRSETLRMTATGGHAVDIPEDQQFTSDIPGRFRELAREGLTSEERRGRSQALRGRRPEFDVGWMEMLDAGNRLFLEAEQDTRVGAGRGRLKLVVENSWGGIRTEQDWPWAFLPGDDYGAELLQIFPWADLSIDEATYRRATFADFVAACARWDKEEQDYLYEEDAEDFDEWFARGYSGQLRPYGHREGEDLALWRLELKLNDFGRSVLQREHDEMYADAMFDSQLEEERDRERAGGWYEVQIYDHGARAASVEGIYFVTDEGFPEPVLADTNLLGQEGSERLLAAAILTDALGAAPLKSLVDAFLDRFANVLESETLPLSTLTAWLAEIRA